MIVVSHAPRPALSLAHELDLAFFEGLAVVPAEDRQQKAPAAALPVDVEELGVLRRAALREHVLPPGVVAVQHAQVVRHDVHHEAHAVAAQRVEQPAQVGLGADLRIDLAVVDDVVAVHAAWARLEKRRRVHVAHAEPGEVRHQSGRVRKAEALVELEAVRGESVRGGSCWSPCTVPGARATPCAAPASTGTCSATSWASTRPTEFASLERDVATDAAALACRTCSEAGGSEPRRRPTTACRLIGRDDDPGRTSSALCESRRLVTLLGPGGIGKTQLAAVWPPLELAPAASAARWSSWPGYATATASSPRWRRSSTCRPQQGRSVTESVLDLLGRPTPAARARQLRARARHDRRLRRAPAAAVCPQVRVLATSREPLGLPTESGVQGPGAAGRRRRRRRSPTGGAPAVRAVPRSGPRAANPDFVADEDAVAAVAELCRRLDGVPLAIELAAARTRSLSPTEIAERLGDRFGLLAGSSRVSRAPPPLAEGSRRLVVRAARPGRAAAVRAGSRSSPGTFDLDAVERVCGFGAGRRRDVGRVVLASLVDKSMVQAFAGRRTTYRLLETLREYGAGARRRPSGRSSPGATAHWIAGICERGAAGSTAPTSGSGWTLSTPCSTTSAWRCATRCGRPTPAPPSASWSRPASTPSGASATS